MNTMRAIRAATARGVRRTDDIFVGVLGLRSIIISFHGKQDWSLCREFTTAIKDYLADCASRVFFRPAAALHLVDAPRRDGPSVVATTARPASALPPGLLRAFEPDPDGKSKLVEPRPSERRRASDRIGEDG